MKARAKDRTNARQDDPAKTGGNPKALPKSEFPFAASIKNILSGDEGDDFVLEGPAAGAKGGEGEEHECHAQPFAASAMKKWAHAEALPIVSARRSIGGMTNHASPRSTTNRHAHDPQVSGAPLGASFAQPHKKRAHTEALPIWFFGGGRRGDGRPSLPRE